MTICAMSIQIKEPTVVARASAIVEVILDNLLENKWWIISPTGKGKVSQLWGIGSELEITPYRNPVSLMLLFSRFNLKKFIYAFGSPLYR